MKSPMLEKKSSHFHFFVLKTIFHIFDILTKASNNSTCRIRKHWALLYRVEFKKYETQKENFYLQTSQMIELATVIKKKEMGESFANLERYLSAIL